MIIRLHLLPSPQTREAQLKVQMNFWLEDTEKEKLEFISTYLVRDLTKTIRWLIVKEYDEIMLEINQKEAEQEAA